jgi:mono/diheme cytochrome c family protein
MNHETLFFICGGILAASAVTVSIIGLKKDDFPGKFMPLIIVWFAIFAVGAGTFAVLHGKDESKDHNAEYAKASEEIEKADTTGPFEEAEAEAREAEKAEAGEGEEGESAESGESEAGNEEAEMEAEESSEGGPEFENGVGNAGEQMEGEAGASTSGGDPSLGTVVFSENCSTCHGATGHGGNGGPDLRTMPLAQTEAGAIEQVTNGGGGMPAFSGILSEEEIENVAAYVAQEITEGE